MGPQLSLVVVAYDMDRELPRTLASLAPGYQHGVEDLDYEVIVVDNGSPTPVDAGIAPALGSRYRQLRIDDASPSPAAAANTGLAAARGETIGLIIDGARLASPGLLTAARRAGALADRAVVTPLAFQLGPARQEEAPRTGYDQTAEDRLLTDCDWTTTGYRLFEVATLAGSSGRGWFGPIGESSALFMPAALWAELDGLDDRFDLPGGGLVNHDLFSRACQLDGAQLMVLLGEGTFHQFHGGASTSRRFTWEHMDIQYEALRGRRYRPPAVDPILVGRVPLEALGHLERSVALARARARRLGAPRTAS